MGDLLKALELQNEDLKFHFNPMSQSKYVLPLTINNRYIICKGRDEGGQATWWLAHPGPHLQLHVEDGEWLHCWSFAQKRYDPREGAPKLVQFRADFVQEHRHELFPLVLTVARRELDACRGSTPCRLAHSSHAYALALDESARAEVLPGVQFGVKPKRK